MEASLLRLLLELKIHFAAHKVINIHKYWQLIFWNTNVIYFMWSVPPSIFVLLQFVVLELKIDNFVVILLAGEHDDVIGRNPEVLAQKIKPIPAFFYAGRQFIKSSTVKLNSVFVNVFELSPKSLLITYLTLRLQILTIFLPS